MGQQSNCTDGYWTSSDALQLHYRDYAGDEGLPPILCLPGLTRNARDFEALATHLAGDWRVIVAELRGRGGSAYAKDPATYAPLTYLQDIEGLIATLGLDRFILIGSSLGGILAMLLAAKDPGRVAAMVLNDVGPELDPQGVTRIRSYLGRAIWYPTWMHAARALAENSAALFPKYEIEDWLAMAKRLYKVNSSGRIVLDYDMKIAEPLRLDGEEAGPDLWPTVDAIRDVPTLLMRGALSDILSEEVAERTVERLRHGILVTVNDVGHAPTLVEPEPLRAIEGLLSSVRTQG